VDDLNWTKEGKTPLLLFEKTENLAITDVHFWLKMGLLLFDSGHYAQSFPAFNQILTLDSSELLKFTALVWMGHLMDLQRQRDKAIEYYKKALEHDTGQTMTHSQYGMGINRQWVEERLKTPFTWKKWPPSERLSGTLNGRHMLWVCRRATASDSRRQRRATDYGRVDRQEVAHTDEECYF